MYFSIFAEGTKIKVSPGVKTQNWISLDSCLVEKEKKILVVGR